MNHHVNLNFLSLNDDVLGFYFLEKNSLILTQLDLD